MTTRRLPEGVILGNRYEILETVGKGGMGTVYRARDARLDTIVAVKEMNESTLAEDEREMGVKQFEREAKLLAALRHPNLPRVSDYFVDGEQWYLIMEFVQGETLDKLMKDQNGAPIDPLRVVNYAVQIADVLDYLHSQDPPIIFRDIKPANIMIQSDDTVKLIDFGIARRFQEGASKDTLLYGSPGYSPPEQYGRTQTDSRSDLYAMAATMHHLLTGRDPASTPFKYPSVRSLIPEIPVKLDLFLAACVEMDIEKRVKTAAEARETLESIREEMLRPRPATTSATASGSTTGPKIISSKIKPSPQPSEGGKVVGIVLAVVVVVLLAIVGGINMMKGKKPADPPVSGGGTPTRVVSPAPAPVVNTPPVKEPDGSAGQRPATLRVTSNDEGATVILDGKVVGVTPLELKEVLPGKRKLAIVPREGSGLARADREIEIAAGQNLLVDTQLARAPETPTSAVPAAQVMATSGSARDIPNPSNPRLMVKGAVVQASFRVTGSSGKAGMISVFFYDSSQNPTRPAQPTSPYRNQDGQLSVAREFRVEADLADFPEVDLYVPADQFTIPLDQVAYRVVIFINNQPIAQSDMRPLTR